MANGATNGYTNAQNGCAKAQETNGRNRYFTARREAALRNDNLSSREGAADLLGISASTLATYELDVCKQIPPDAVVMMADLYKAPELKNHYCVNQCPIGKDRPISTSVSSVELATVKMIRAFCADMVEGAKTRLVDIAADGQITADELQTLDWIVEYLDGMAKTISELKLTCQKALAEAGE